MTTELAPESASSSRHSNQTTAAARPRTIHFKSREKVSLHAPSGSLSQGKRKIVVVSEQKGAGTRFERTFAPPSLRRPEQKHGFVVVVVPGTAPADTPE